MLQATKKLAAVCAMMALESAAFAHPGHHMGGSHWHATDAWGFAAIGVMVIVAVWLTRGGK